MSNAHRPLRILIVDDEPAHAEAIRRALEEVVPPMAVQIVGSLREYHAAVAAAVPDLALLDLLLPDGRADAALTAPPEAGAFPIIVMTSHGDEQVAAAMIQNGALDYVVKSPEAFAALPRAVERTRRVWRSLMEHRQAQAELQASEARFASLFRNSPSAIAISRLSDGRFLDVNTAFTELYGYAREEILGHTAVELGLWHATDRAPMIQELEARRQVRNLKLRARRKNGELRDLLVSLELVELNGEPCIVGNLVDVTDLRLAEAKLHRSEERYHSFVHHSHEAIYCVELDAPIDTALPLEQQLDLIYERAYIGECNQAMAALYGLASPETLVGCRLAQLHRGKNHAGHREVVRRFIQNQYHTVDAETDEVTPDGWRRFLRRNETGIVEAGRLVRIWGSALDITDRLQARRARALSTEVLTILNETPPETDPTPGILDAIKLLTGFDAVGIRLRDGGDYPYAGSAGFSSGFLRAENSLVLRDHDDGFCRDEQGNVPLECTCGLVISGKTDPANPLFTPGGTAWTNDAPQLLHVPAGEDPRLNPRNRCIHEGYNSVALIPIRVDREIVGLLQLNDRRKGCFTPESIQFFEGLAASFGVALLRRRQAVRLRDSERNLRSLFDVIPESVFLAEPEGRVLAANATFAARLGKPLEAVVGRNVFDLLPPEAAARRREWLAEVGRQRRTLTFEDERAGRWQEHHVCPILGEEGAVKRVVVVAVDLTQHKRVEAQVRHQASLLNSLLDSIPDIVFVKDLNGVYRGGNPAFFQFVGRPREEIIGRTDHQLFPAAKADAFVSSDQLMLAGMDSRSIEEWIEYPNGRKVFVETMKTPHWGPDGKMIGVLGISRDITERKASEAALRQSEERLQMALIAASMGTWEVNLAPTTLEVRWTRQYGALFGREPAQFPTTEQAFLECVHPQDREMVQQTFRGAIREQAAFKCEFRIRWPDGTIRWHVAMGRALPGPGGGTERIVGAGMDTTERRELETQLRQAQKLEAIGQLAGGVAHDFNNILAAIMMHLGLLRMNPHIDDDTRRSLAELDEAARRAANLTRQLLMFSRRSVLTVKSLDLNEVITNLLKMLTRLIGEHIDLRFDGQGGLAQVEADTGMIEQILMNLVVNARDAMPKGGRITIRTAGVQLGEAQTRDHPDRRPGRYVCLEVADTGSGMDAETLKRIFEPFFTTKEPGKGTGLGLATVHGIVAQHQGWVEVESEVNQGTTFRVFLPALEKAAAPTAKPARAAAPPRGQETILLVEDEDRVRLVLRHSLKALGYRVFEAGNGQEAMALWLQQKGQVDLLLTDMVMPEGVTGLELAEQLRALKPELKVIISSGYSSEFVQSGAPTGPGVVYLPKPYTANVLAETVRNCLDQKS